MPSLNVVELYCGWRGWSKPWAEAGHRTWATDIDPKFDPDLAIDALELTPDHVPFRPDVVLASPPCESFSTGSFRHHFTATAPCRNCRMKLVRVSGERWVHTHTFGACANPVAARKPDLEPKSDKGRLGVALLERTLWLLEQWQPRYWVIENPRAGMRRMPQLAQYDRRTVSYCLYGQPNRKPTDLWGGFPESFQERGICTAHGRRPIRDGYRLNAEGERCHEAAERGAKTGTQGLPSDVAAIIPRELAEDYMRACLA